MVWEMSAKADKGSTGEMCTQNFPLLMKDMNSKVQEVHGILCSINKTISTGRHTDVEWKTP